jgi:hypothetical protein
MGRDCVDMSAGGYKNLKENAPAAHDTRRGPLINASQLDSDQAVSSS